ncbi:hypothetical protein AVEN_96085-1 [Araneus ventricosus]|uniref:Uncharacterized protein n=1 Tax=Araneus ventricosus TaxID=182803 RepID=A0A4Y2B3E8_ARAVE|nr:hypothetical protein AVEN_96085-1 [Araneus ventricosus]
MTRMTPESAPLLQTSAQHQREDIWPSMSDLLSSGTTYHGESLAEDGFELGALPGVDLMIGPPPSIQNVETHQI